MKSFDPARSRVVLVGTPSYSDPDLPDVPVITRNVADLQAVFTDPELGGFDPAHCVVVPPDATVAQIGAVLVGAAAEAEDLLLFYYCGHGLVSGQSFELYLSVAETRHNLPQFSALSFAAVREAFLDSPAATRVVILDSCFSGKAIGQPLASEDTVVLGQVEVEGSYVLTAAPSNKTAVVRPGEAHTAFTERFLRLLREGSPRAGRLLTLGEIYRGLRASLAAGGLPQPQQRGIGNADQLGLVPNRAYGLKATGAAGQDNSADDPALDPAGQPAYGLSASGAEAGRRDEPGTAGRAIQPGEPVARRPAIPAGAPIAGAIWTAPGPEVFALRDGHIWCTHRSSGGDWADRLSGGNWADWAEFPYTGNRKPFIAVAAHSEPEKGERNAVLGVIGAAPYVNDAKGLWGAMTRPGAGALHDMRLADVAIATPQEGPGGTAFAVEAQGQVWQRSGGNWFSPDPWEEIPAGRAPVSAIAACSDGDSVPAFFAVAGGKMYSRRRGLYWMHPWEDMPALAASVVDVACWSLGKGHIHVFALDIEGRIWSIESSNGTHTWANWQPVNPPPGEARVIAATSRHANNQYLSRGDGMLIAVTADGLIYEGRHVGWMTHDLDWPTWSQLPPLFHG